ncbi:MAG: 4Fe-4S dicluster domain-containing protein [Planctomycetes bacterium]|nr:4Fe-4S dicluster domain-containing protein [Planctomycetota bacterium]MBL7106285.1 4Fe-4S dicluster domain-containing protein [Phycisphaerae bacterium]
MSKKKLSKKDFDSLVDVIISKTKVYGAVADANKTDCFDFKELKSASGLRLDYDVTLQAPRKFFLPPVEELLTFGEEGSYKSSYECEPFVLLGVHPYDMIAINQMDELFSQDNYDSHYFARRNNATIVALDVITPSENVFASSMKTATVDNGYDVLLTDIGDCYIIDAATEKGEELVKLAENASEATGSDLEKRQKVQDDNKKRLNKHELKCDPSYLPKLLEKAYDHPVWEETAKTCFGCGSCNQVCPTCYCFNVKDDVNWDLANGKRERSWDGCLLNGFTKVAPDHEFRSSQADRFRHRLYRKAKYVPNKIGGQIACVGCGRCVSACLPDIANPVKIYNRLVEDLGIE